MQEMREMLLKQQESVLQTESERAEEQHRNVTAAMQSLSIVPATPLDDDAVRSRQDLLRELQQQQASNDAFSRLCEDLLARTVKERTGQQIRRVKATEDSIAVAGFINTAGAEMSVRQDISDVTADKRSFAGAGIIKNLDFGSLHQSKHQE